MALHRNASQQKRWVWQFVLALLASVVVAGCPDSNGGGCTKDTDCKGDRFCEKGVCVAPPSLHAGGAAGAASMASGTAGSGAAGSTASAGGAGAAGVGGAATGAGGSGVGGTVTGAGGAGGSAGAGGATLDADCCPAGWLLENDACIPVDACVDNSCPPESCDPGWADCNGLSGDGCETNLTLLGDCGSCGNACSAGQVCGPSGCTATCDPPLTHCNGSCVSLAFEANHCGQCGKICSAPAHAIPECNAGTCDFTCIPGLTRCGDECFNLQIDGLHCGSCTRCTAPAGGSASCLGGACVQACPSGTTDCGGTCVNTMTYADHCGGCGIDCGTGACVAGICDPTLSPLVVAIASALGDLQVDDQNVYFIDEGAGSIVRVGKFGGSPVNLAVGQAAPKRLVIDSSFVYWTNSLGAAVMRVPKAGGTATLVATASQPAALAVSSAEVFWFNETDDTVMKAPKDGSGPAVLLWASDHDTQTNLAVDEPYLYWSEWAIGLKIWRIPTAGGVPSNAGYTELAFGLDADRLYLSQGGGGLLASVLKTGGPERDLGWMNHDHYGDFEVDDNYIYFQAGVIHKSNKCGDGTPMPVAFISGGPRIALDKDYVYWSSGSSIYRAGK
jgi:hypothetical protein